MKRFLLAIPLALVAVSGVVVSSGPAQAQTPWYDVARGRTGVVPYVGTGPAWINIARSNPAPAYRPYGGYYRGARVYRRTYRPVRRYRRFVRYYYRPVRRVRRYRTYRTSYYRPVRYRYYYRRRY